MKQQLIRLCKILPFFAAVPLLLYMSAAQALPSFARQTGEACTACHVQTWGANLTPRGREFKLKGYTEGEGKWIPPLSVVAEGGGFLNLDDKNSQRSFFGRPIPQPKDRSYFTGSVFYAGKIAGPVGAYVEGSYAHDPESGEGTGFLNKVDLRFAHQVNVAGHQVDYGISVNNEPGVQDLWNTNAVWNSNAALTPESFLLFGRPTIPLFPFSPFVDRGHSSHVVGGSIYALINKLLYVEAGGYASLPRDVQRGIGREIDGFNFDIDGGAPYWRIALQHEWDGHYFSIGHFGLQANQAGKVTHLGGGGFLLQSSLRMSDLGMDVTYQYLANPEHIFEFKGRYVRENTVIGPSVSVALINGSHESTDEIFNFNGAYTWSQTLGISVGYQQYRLDAPHMNRYFDVNYLTTELAYTPFGKQNSLASPWANLRLGLTYIATLNNLDGLGFVSSVPQDSLYLSGRLAF